MYFSIESRQLEALKLSFGSLGGGGEKKRKERKSGERKGGDGRVVHHRPVSRRQSSPDNSLSPVMWSRPPVDAISKQLDTCSSVIVVVVTVSRRRSVKSHKKLFCSASPRRKRRRLLKQRESRVQAVDRVQQGASHILSRDHRDAAAATESPGRPTDAGLLDVGLFYRHTHGLSQFDNHQIVLGRTRGTQHWQDVEQERGTAGRLMRTHLHLFLLHLHLLLHPPLYRRLLATCFLISITC